MLSNNLTINVKRLYPLKEYYRTKVEGSRSISGLSYGRGKIPELLVTNY